MKFKVGDYVRIIKDLSYHKKCPQKDHVGKITKIYYDHNIYVDKYELEVFEYEIELANEYMKNKAFDETITEILMEEIE